MGNGKGDLAEGAPPEGVLKEASFQPILTTLRPRVTYLCSLFPLHKAPTTQHKASPWDGAVLGPYTGS